MGKKLSKVLYRLDAIQIAIAFGACFLLGIVLGFFIWGDTFNNIYQRIWKLLTSPNTESLSGFLALCAEFLGAFVGIAIPISLGIVSENLKTFKDKDIAKMFLNEKEYKYQFWIVIPTIIYVLILEFLQIRTMILLYLALFLMIISIILFVKYIQLIQRYSTKTEEIVYEWAKNKINEILD